MGLERGMCFIESFMNDTSGALSRVTGTNY